MKRKSYRTLGFHNPERGVKIVESETVFHTTRKKGTVPVKYLTCLDRKTGERVPYPVHKY